MTEDHTGKVVRWIRSHSVLAHRLRLIASDGVQAQDGDQELACTVADLLDPDRKVLWADYLRTAGVPFDEADRLWKELGGIAGMYPVHWDQVRAALLSE